MGQIKSGGFKYEIQTSIFLSDSIVSKLIKVIYGELKVLAEAAHKDNIRNADDRTENERIKDAELVWVKVHLK